MSLQDITLHLNVFKGHKNVWSSKDNTALLLCDKSKNRSMELGG